MSKRPFCRSFARYRRRGLAVFALGCLIAVAAANCPKAPFDEVPSAAPTAAPVVRLSAVALAAPITSTAEDKFSVQRAALLQRQAEIQSELADVEARLQKNESEHEAIEAEITFFAAQPAQPAIAPAKVNPIAIPAPADNLRQQLAALRSREHELTAKMRDNHPLLLAVRQQIADLQASIGKLPAKRQPTEPAPDHQPFDSEKLAAERARAEILVIEKRPLLAAREGLIRQLTETNTQIDALPWHSHSATAHEVQPAHNSDVAALPPVRLPSLQPDSSSKVELLPSRAAISATGILLAALLGLVTALVSAARNPLLCTPRQLETIWDLPLAGSIPPDLRLVPAAA
jgi:hypothetical protein